MEQIQVLIHYIRSTKNKHVYSDDEFSIGSLYIPRESLPADPPDTLEVTVGDPS